MYMVLFNNFSRTSAWILTKLVGNHLKCQGPKVVCIVCMWPQEGCRRRGIPWNSSWDPKAVEWRCIACRYLCMKNMVGSWKQGPHLLEGVIFSYGGEGDPGAKNTFPSCINYCIEWFNSNCIIYLPTKFKNPISPLPMKPPLQKSYHPYCALSLSWVPCRVGL